MKSEDFKELQEFCQRKGYQLLNESLEDNTKFFVVSKKIEKVRVNLEWCGMTSINGKFHFTIENDSISKDSIKIGNFLASKLEEYLNK
jgi:hypothetical protein